MFLDYTLGDILGCLAGKPAQGMHGRKPIWSLAHAGKKIGWILEMIQPRGVEGRTPCNPDNLALTLEWQELNDSPSIAPGWDTWVVILFGNFKYTTQKNENRHKTFKEPQKATSSISYIVFWVDKKTRIDFFWNVFAMGRLTEHGSWQLFCISIMNPNTYNTYIDTSCTRYLCYFIFLFMFLIVAIFVFQFLCIFTHTCTQIHMHVLLLYHIFDLTVFCQTLTKSSALVNTWPPLAKINSYNPPSTSFWWGGFNPNGPNVSWWWLIVECKFLFAYDATFAENFFGLRRRKLIPSANEQKLQPLSYGDKVYSVLTHVVFAYLSLAGATLCFQQVELRLSCSDTACQWMEMHRIQGLEALINGQRQGGGIVRGSQQCRCGASRWQSGFWSCRCLGGGHLNNLSGVPEP